VGTVVGPRSAAGRGSDRPREQGVDDTDHVRPPSSCAAIEPDLPR